MAFFVYLILYICSVGFASSAAKSCLRTDKTIWNYASSYGLLIFFSFIVGTRYFVGLDYETYMDVVISGESHYLYDHFELLPRIFIDIVNKCNLEFYWWFILMAFTQMLFLMRAVRGPLVKVFPWVIFCFLTFQLAFYMNVVRQGAALSCFLCAATYAQERKLKPYLIYFLLGFWCHTSIIFWLPTYWIFNRELFPTRKIQFLLFFTSSLFVPLIIQKIINITLSYLELLGYGYVIESLTGDADLELGSGLGMMLRYIRWGIIIAYYDKLKNYYGAEHFVLLYNLFFIGICFDASTAFIIILSRVFMYGSIVEIIILPYLFNYLLCNKSQLNRLVFWFLLLMLMVLILQPILTGAAEWNFVWS